MITHDLPDGRIINSHVLDALPSLPAESIQTCITSPPYYGLRSYSGEQRTIWGGNLDCEHEWDLGILPATKMAQKGSTETVKHPTLVAQETGKAGQTCSRCGAWYGAYGLEPTPALWAEHTLLWLRAVRRVLRKDGTVWLNVGSSYTSGATSVRQASTTGTIGGWTAEANVIERNGTPAGYKPLDLIDPFALLYPGLLADGWYVRSVVIWAKPNPMPESIQGTRFERHKVKLSPSARAEKGAHVEAYGESPQGARDGREFANHDSEWADCPGCPKCAHTDGLVLRRGSWRPTSSFEYVIMLAKSASYYSDGEGVREPISPDSLIRAQYEFNGMKQIRDNPDGRANTGNKEQAVNPAGRNLRDVWQIPTQSFPESHFATYPEELVKRCILASTPDAGACAVCGSPWARVVRKGEPPPTKLYAHNPGAFGGRGGLSESQVSGTGGGANVQKWLDEHPSQTLGWRPTCVHSETAPATILDPFGGSMTSAVVARSLGRRFVCIELSADYVQMGLRRLMLTQPAMAGLV